MNPDKKKNVMKGITCPKRNIEIFKFKLKSDIFGEATSSLQVPVFLIKNFEKEEGETQIEQKVVEPVKLTVDSDNMEISSTG